MGPAAARAALAWRWGPPRCPSSGGSRWGWGGREGVPRCLTYGRSPAAYAVAMATVVRLRLGAPALRPADRESPPPPAGPTPQPWGGASAQLVLQAGVGSAQLGGPQGHSPWEELGGHGFVGASHHRLRVSPPGPTGVVGLRHGAPSQEDGTGWHPLGPVVPTAQPGAPRVPPHQAVR